MENVINIESILIVNGMALILAIQLLFGDDWKYRKHDMDWKYIGIIVYVSAVACIIDPIVFLADGHVGLGNWLIVYIGNMILFVDDIIVGVSWISIVCKHLLGHVPKYQKYLIAGFSAIGLIAIVVNMFVPVIYYVDENSVYHRSYLYWLFTAIVGFFLLDSIVVYLYSKVRGGIFKFFPVFQFIFPIVAGVTIQSLVYGVSVVWPAVIISVMCLQNSLKTEFLYTDSLTGLYNRTYLGKLGREIEKKGSSASVAVLMLDINKFKSINDEFGHAEGDVALRKVAEILKSTVGSLGSAIRYAGDEFIILLNTKQAEIIEGCIRSIQRRFAEENEKTDKKYDLTMAIGSCSISAQTPTLDDMINDADKMMYVDKKKSVKYKRKPM